MITKEIVSELVNSRLEGTGKFLVDVSVQPGNKIFVYIDGDHNLSIADCQVLNRELEQQFDREVEDYELTVSTYGIDRPIRIPRQYRKNIGKEMDVTLTDGTKLAGILVFADDQSIELEHPVKKPKKEVKQPNSTIRIEEIKTAKIILKFGK